MPWVFYMLKFSSNAQSCPILRDPIDCSTPGLPVHSKVHRFGERHQFYYVELRKLNKVDGNLFLYLLWVLFILPGINIILYL